MFLNLLLLLIVLYGLSSVVRYLVRSKTFRTFETQNHCAPAKTIPNKFPYGWGHKIHLLRPKGDFLDDVLALKYATFGSTHALHTPLTNQIKVISTIDPENIQAILSTRFKDYGRVRSRVKALDPLLGEGIFTSDGQAWSHARTLLRPEFTLRRLKDIRSLETHVGYLFQAIGETDQDGWIKEVELLELFFDLTLDSISEFLFGTSIGSHITTLQGKHAIGNGDTSNSTQSFSEALNYANDCIGRRFRLGSLYWLWDTLPFRQACSRVHNIVDKFIADISNDHFSGRLDINDESNLEKGPNDGSGLLHSLISQTRSSLELRNQALHILTAGRDTTAVLLAWVFVMLTRHPDDLSRLRQEIISHFGSESEPKNEINFRSLKACTYLQWVIIETLRLYPAGPFNGRMVLRDTVLPVGGGPDGQQPVAVPKGAIVNYSSYLVQRRKDLWGDDANEWKPERWEGRKVGWEFTAFSGGPRVCLGQQYALTETAFVVVRMLQHYPKIQSVESSSTIRKGYATILCPADGIRVKLFKPKGDS
ncbi:MAG: hypothetical protein M1834_006317 [Cirrosporium novae-zelandiae]|nr:MAG: hypothetical protein M1834_006317 [Cirrosporium novae-zelandiae]